MPATQYVLVTAARNEALFIRPTIESVLAQTLRPVRWVIVCNGSTDGTEIIAEEYAARFPLISVLRSSSSAPRDFAAKVQAIRAAYEQLAGIEFEFVGNLDADITLPSTYYESLLGLFETRPRLGLASGIYLDLVKGSFRRGRSNILYPSGAIEVFRRECYETLGGYPPLRTGGEDSAAAIMARMKGWETRAFSHLVTLHRRPWGTGGGSRILSARFQQGGMDYHLGMHPLYALAKTLSRITEQPFASGCLFRLAGYARSWLKQEERILPDEVIRYARAEQMERLRGYFPEKARALFAGEKRTA